MRPLTEYIAKWHEDNDRKPAEDKGALHPSSLGDCNRRTIFKFLGLPRDLEFNDFKKKIFYHGYAIEGWMTEALRAQGLLIASSVPVRAEYQGIRIEGTIDQIRRWEDGWCIMDTKSVSDHAFKHKSFPYHHHVLQVGLYQWALQHTMHLPSEQLVALLKSAHTSVDPSTLRHLAEGKHGPQYPPVLSYVGRGNLKELPPVTAGDGCMDLALEKLDELLPHIKNEVYPPRPFRTPEEHPYLCSSCIKRGYRKNDGTYSEGKEPEYIPNCEYWYRCWEMSKELTRWSFWWEVKGKELAF